MNSDVAHLADRIVATSFLREPLEAALLGPSEGSSGLADLTAAHEQELSATHALIAADVEQLQERAARGALTLDEFDALTLDMVGRSAATAAEYVKAPLVGFTITDFFTAPRPRLISVLSMLTLDTPERQNAQLERLEVVPRFLEQATQRHRDALAQGLTPPTRGVRAEIAQIDEITSDPRTVVTISHRPYFRALRVSRRKWTRVGHSGTPQ
jgi:uncharacterized protein (DUF885 family)